MKNEVDKYISTFPKEVQPLLEQVRATIKQAAPHAEETFKWKMPTFVLRGNLVHFAGYKNHIGFYPGASGVETFREVFSDYKSSKGAIQFPLNKPIPFHLITDVVKFRVKENLDDFSSLLPSPAKNALTGNGITTLTQLAKYSEKEILEFHGMGKSSIPKLQKALSELGLEFKK